MSSQTPSGRSAPTICLATRADAARIAQLSRDLIEVGLGWDWTPARVMRCIRDRSTNVVVAYPSGQTPAPASSIGFGIMKYGEDDAHLVLLAVDARWQRQGVATAMLGWLEAVACAAGLAQVQVEARASNAEALAFYGRHGYRVVAEMPGYYRGREAALRLNRALGTAAVAGLAQDEPRQRPTLRLPRFPRNQT
jgi:[ribosomal protein S18]-alanine N-acetyltransferase